jgi:hypothetical protein
LPRSWLSILACAELIAGASRYRASRPARSESSQPSLRIRSSSDRVAASDSPRSASSWISARPESCPSGSWPPKGTAVIVENTSAGTALTISKFMPFAVAGVMIAWMTVYGQHAKRKGEAAQAAQAAEPLP